MIMLIPLIVVRLIAVGSLLANIALPKKPPNQLDTPKDRVNSLSLDIPQNHSPFCHINFLNWEVLYGVGVDGVGAMFFFFVFFPFTFVEEHITAICRKIGNRTPTPSAPTAFKISRLTPILWQAGAQAMNTWTAGSHRYNACCWPVLMIYDVGRTTMLK